MASEIRNPQLWQDGRLKIDWVRHNMPLLNSLEEEFKATQPFKGLKVALSVHLEAKTAYLCEVLAAGGAEMYVTGSNPLSTQDDVAAALVEASISRGAEFHAAAGGDHRGGPSARRGDTIIGVAVVEGVEVPPRAHVAYDVGAATGGEGPQ